MKPRISNPKIEPGMKKKRPAFHYNFTRFDDNWSSHETKKNPFQSTFYADFVFIDRSAANGIVNYTNSWRKKILRLLAEQNLQKGRLYVELDNRGSWRTKSKNGPIQNRVRSQVLINFSTSCRTHIPNARRLFCGDYRATEFLASKRNGFKK